MFSDFLNKAHHLYDDKNPFAMAMVVRREVPSSGKPGDKAVITANGEITGWIGGGCTRGIIVKEAQLSMQDGKPRLVRISPSGETTTQKGVMDYKMTCHSGGTVEVYIEPVLPKPHLIIMGKSHVAMALCKLARAMDYSVGIVSRDADALTFPTASFIKDRTNLEQSDLRANTYIVVCTQGEADEQALESALSATVDYVAFVASRRKANGVFKYLMQQGVSTEKLRTVKTPAGLDIKAKLPEEVAISILAQIIEHLRTETKPLKPEVLLSNNDNIYINPVCGIPVEKSTAKHILTYKDESVYFCCDGCKVKFEAEPEKYMTA